MSLLASDTLAEIDERSIGAKAANLARLERWGFPVPRWAVIPAAVFMRHVDTKCLNSDPEDIRAHVRSLVIDDILKNSIVETVSRLNWGNHLLAVRSSSIGEDSAELSFAGQLESYLFVPAHDIGSAVLNVWASGFSDRAVSYRRENLLSIEDTRVAVIVQEMIDADVSGVAFSIDPVSGDRRAVVV
ncbi:MAG: hypothetical protein JXA18_08000, partial [Chitinispirillaceae bacterium]|nr:hypothetical protein [Chitinispirillaceae bacterium]